MRQQEPGPRACRTRPAVWAVVLFTILGASTAAAASGGENGMPWADIAIGLFGGLALFLFGLDQLAKGLQAAAGAGMRFVLAKLTRNRFLGALTGAFVTAILNSSSVTTVLVVGFITAGMMTLSQSIGVIMGANIGSTVTAQIIAFDVTRYALLLVASGFSLLFVSKRDKVRHSGAVLMGLGLVFFGMGIMGESMTPLRSYTPFLNLMASMENPWLGILFGAVFTGLVQSSAATTGIAIVMAGEGLITLSAGIALALGANIGTCVTALLASIGKPREAQQAAVAHIVFNVLGVLMWVGSIDTLAAFVIRISPTAPELQGTARVAAEVPRQIANAHTLFNVANTLVFIWFTKPFARLIRRIVPDRPPPGPKETVRPKYLDDGLVRTPSLALGRVRLEVGRLGAWVGVMLDEMRSAFVGGETKALNRIDEQEDRVDLLQKQILGYMGRVRKEPLSDSESSEFLALMTAGDALESVGDVVDTKLGTVWRKAIDRDIVPSDTMRRMLSDLSGTISDALRTAVRGVRDNDPQAGHDVLSMRSEVDARTEEILRHQAMRLAGDEAKRPDTFRIEMEAVAGFNQIYTLTRRIARTVVPTEEPDDNGA